MLGTSSYSTPAASGTAQRDPTCRVVSSPSSGIASTPTPLSGLENLPTAIPNPEACAIITNPVQTRATGRNRRQRQWQLQPQAVSTPLSEVSGSGTSARKYFRPGGMAPSEWMRYVRGIRDTLVADYSVPGLNTTRRVAYLPPIPVSVFLLALSVSYCKRTLWCCGQL